jgi:hypothetical protein
MAKVPEYEFDDEARRQRFELRLLQAEAAREGELAARRGVSLAEAVAEVCALGSLVVVDVPGATFRGTVAGVTEALLRLRVADDRLCDVVLDQLVAVREVKPGSAQPTPSGLSTLSTVLADAEVHGYDVTLHLDGAEPMAGRVVVAGREHVELTGGRGERLLVRLSAIVAVVRPESPGDGWADG